MIMQDAKRNGHTVKACPSIPTAVLPAGYGPFIVCAALTLPARNGLRAFNVDPSDAPAPHQAGRLTRLRRRERSPLCFFLHRSPVNENVGWRETRIAL